MKFVKNRRAGFTLLELLVVIGIIGLLAAMTATAVFRLKTASQQTRTNETLSKLHQAMEMQYKASIDVIRKEQIDPRLIALANDMDLAKAIHLKMRLRREFPQNIADVNNSATTGTAATDTILHSMYPPKAVYTTLLPTLTAGGMTPEKQNAILLMAILSQARGGASFNPEQIGANAVTTLQGTDRKIFVDGYGNPIYFIRSIASTPVGNSPQLLIELNGPPYVTGAAVTAKKADPADPLAKLSLSTSGFVASMRTFMGEPLDGTFRGPFLFSGGTDNTPFTDDDLHSFRLQNTGKAN